MCPSLALDCHWHFHFHLQAANKPAAESQLSMGFEDLSELVPDSKSTTLETEGPCCVVTKGFEGPCEAKRSCLLQKIEHCVALLARPVDALAIENDRERILSVVEPIPVAELDSLRACNDRD